MTAMISRFPSSRGRPVLFVFAALVVVALASCSGGPANQPPAPPAPAAAGSVQDQLAQLAADAATATSGPAAPTTAPAIVRASATPAATQGAAVLQPKPTRTRRPSAAAAASPGPTRRPSAAPTRGARATRAPASSDNLQTISQAQLPREARATIRLIEQGGPFPYSRDGVTFENREGLLPKRPSGYYKEYTVITPGSADRGARRIIAGQAGELYYTDDHYDSFKRVVP